MNQFPSVRFLARRAGEICRTAGAAIRDVSYEVRHNWRAGVYEVLPSTLVAGGFAYGATSLIIRSVREPKTDTIIAAAAGCTLAAVVSSWPCLVVKDLAEAGRARRTHDHGQNDPPSGPQGPVPLSSVGSVAPEGAEPKQDDLHRRIEIDLFPRHTLTIPYRARFS